MRKINRHNLNDDFEILTVRSLEEIEGIRSVWKEIQIAEAYPTINADIDRYISVVQAGADTMQPHVILIKEDSQPIALVVARTEETEIKVRFGYETLFSPKLKCLTVVHGGIIGRISDEISVVLIGELMNVLNHGEADMVFFNHLKTDSFFYELARKSPDFVCREYFPKVESHWRIHIPDNMSIFYKSLSSQRARTLKKTIRKFEKSLPDKIKITSHCTEDKLEQLIKTCAGISAKTYQKGLGVGFTDDSRTFELLKIAARKGRLRIHLLSVEERPWAFFFGLAYRGILFGEQMGYDPEWRHFSVGTILFLKVIESLCADPEIDILDLGFGDAWYKTSFGTEKWPEASVYIFAPRLYPVCVNLLDSAFRGMSLGSAKVAKKIAVVDWVKRHWRNFLRTKNISSA